MSRPVLAVAFAVGLAGCAYKPVPESDTYGAQTGLVRAVLAGARPVDTRVEDEACRGCTLLAWALEHRKPELAQALLARGADVSVRDAVGRSPLHHASRSGALVQALLAHGADPLFADRDGQLPIHAHAAECGFTSLQLWDVAPQTLRLRDHAGNTPLHLVATTGKGAQWERWKGLCSLLARRFLALGADPRAVNAAGDTPLHVAARAGRANLAKVLLEGGADPNARNAAGETPLHLAAARDDDDLAELLTAHGAR
jgi:ankyrin repeat protein